MLNLCPILYPQKAFFKKKIKNFSNCIKLPYFFYLLPFSCHSADAKIKAKLHNLLFVASERKSNKLSDMTAQPSQYSPFVKFTPFYSL